MLPLAVRYSLLRRTTFATASVVDCLLFATRIRKFKNPPSRRSGERRLPLDQGMLRAGASEVFIKGVSFDAMILALLHVADLDDPEPSFGAA